MKILSIIIMTVFITSLFGCRPRGVSETKDILPAESYSVLEATLNNKPVIGSFNIAYKNYDKKAKYPWCLTISMALDTVNLFTNGLPKDNESAIAYKFEDELVADIKKLGTTHYIGHLFNDTFLDIYIYLADPEKVHQFLQTQINKEGLARPFRYEINNDPKWSTVKGFLR
jgi:hypothetical protein